MWRGLACGPACRGRSPTWVGLRYMDMTMSVPCFLHTAPRDSVRIPGSNLQISTVSPSLLNKLQVPLVQEALQLEMCQAEVCSTLPSLEPGSLTMVGTSTMVSPCLWAALEKACISAGVFKTWQWPPISGDCCASFSQSDLAVMAFTRSRPDA